jgi:SPP1 family predicted phage head-tail adaptor
MKAGSLDRRIDILRHTATGKDTMNAQVKTWAPITSEPIPAAKEDIRDGERFRASEQGATITTRFQVRWSPAVADVDPTHRIQFDGREYDIAGVKEIGRREGLEITASARSERS